MNGEFDRLVIEPFRNLFDRISDFLPNLFFAILIFAAGLVVAVIIKYAARGLSRLIGLDRRAEKWGLPGQLRKWGMAGDFSDIAGEVAFWLFAFLFLVIALNALEVAELNVLLSRFFLYLPTLFVALIVLFAGYVFSNFLARAALVWAVNSGFRAARLISRSAQLLVMLLAVTMALEQLGIGRTTILVVFTVLFGGVVLGFSIAFGLGGRKIAKEFLEKRLKAEGRDEIEHL